MTRNIRCCGLRGCSLPALIALERTWDCAMGRRSTATILALLMAVAVTACAHTHQAADERTSADSLWSSRTHYVGDNSRVAALVSGVSPSSAGSYTIRLQTAKPPYGLTIALERIHKPLEDTALEEPATLLLGLVNNLDKVTVTWPGHAYSLTAAAASKNLGYDVKVLGRDRDKLTSYLNVERD